MKAFVYPSLIGEINYAVPRDFRRKCWGSHVNSPGWRMYGYGCCLYQARVDKTFTTSTIEKSLNFPFCVYFYSCRRFWEGFWNSCGGSVGGQRETVNCSLNLVAFPLQTFAKCPFSGICYKRASRAGYLERGCLVLPQRNYVWPSACAAARMVESNYWVGLAGGGTAALKEG